jgi:flagellar hook-length control protein FliK
MTPTSIAVPAVAPTQATPAVPAASPESEQGIAADFLLMLGQLVAGTAPQQGGSDVPAQAVDVPGKSDDASDAGDPIDVAALIPLSLPLAPPLHMHVATSPVTASTAEPVGQASAVGSSTLAAEAQIVSKLICHDGAGDEAAPSFDIPPLPVQPQETHAARSTAPPETALARPVHEPVGSRAWADEIGSRVMLMAEHGKHTASLRLSPEHLGPLEIQVTMHDDQASVWFGAAHADTRAAIETALPRLRELFASQGLSLADAGVFREPPRQQGAPVVRASAAHESAPNPEPVAASQRLVRLGLIDAYA